MAGFQLDGDGMIIVEPKVQQRRFAGIEQGRISDVNGIIVHQTYSRTVPFGSYSQPGANGSHFVVDKDGTIYQTASLYQRVNHVGPIKARCVLEASCTADEYKNFKTMSAKNIGLYERDKPYPQRFPSNQDSIGIELVGWADDDPANKNGEKIYEQVTDAQNASLQWIIDHLRDTIGKPLVEIRRHPDVARKTPSEASSAVWK